MFWETLRVLDSPGKELKKGILMFANRRFFLKWSLALEGNIVKPNKNGSMCVCVFVHVCVCLYSELHI